MASLAEVQGQRESSWGTSGTTSRPPLGDKRLPNVSLHIGGRKQLPVTKQGQKRSSCCYDSPTARVTGQAATTASLVSHKVVPEAKPQPRSAGEVLEMIYSYIFDVCVCVCVCVREQSRTCGLLFKAQVGPQITVYTLLQRLDSV
jgi:hypothetical protein